ncbi:MAG TPA: hypothetical protein VK207_12790 [Bacteroidales bacterium]|nr:hypothetical protein [Bacteroidales bacterium]
MAQKQIIWSGYAKKTIYSALEAIVRDKGNRDDALQFFLSISKKLLQISKTPVMFLRTSGKDVYAFWIGEYLVLFETRESGLIVHSVSENRQAGQQ